MGFFNLFSRRASNIEEALGAKDTTSQKMQDNLKECYELMYEGNTDREDNCMRLPALIIDKLTKATFSEYETDAENDEIKTIVDKLGEIKEKAMQSLLLGGEMLIKPIVRADGFDFSVVKRDCFVPLARNEKGVITSVGLSELTIDDAYYYTLIEKRTATPEGLRIQYKLFRSPTRGTLGTEVDLHRLPKYATLEPDTLIPGIEGTGLTYVKTPVLNNIDGSNDGVCIYSTATDLIKRINLNEMQMNDEFALGQSRIIAPSSMFLKDPNGKLKLHDKVFTVVEGDADDQPIQIFSPTLREESYLRRKTEYLRNIENLIGLKHGLLADVSMEDKTATEITDSKGDYALSIAQLQNTWTNAVIDTINLCIEYSYVYDNMITRNFERGDIVIDYGDGVLYNRDKTAQELLSMVAAGILRPEKYLAWYYSLPDDTPEDLENIRKKYMPEMEALFNG